MINKEKSNTVRKVYVVTFIDNLDDEDWRTYNTEVFNSLKKAQQYVEDEGYTEYGYSGQTWHYKTDKPWYGYLIEEFELK